MAVASRSGPSRLHRRDLDQDKHGAVARLGAERQAPARLRAAWPLAHADIPGRVATRQVHGALRLRRTDQRRMLPRPCRTATRANHQTRRHRHHGQSRQPQIPRRATGAPGRRREALVSPALFARPKPDRTDLRQNQTLDATGPKRTIEDARRHIGHLARAIEPGECSNYFANPGYGSIKT